jgi:dihydrolipoamide dehydrogenase
MQGRGREADEGVAFLFKPNSVEWIKGTGTLKDANTIGVEGSEDVSCKSAIIATGSFPLRTPIQRLESDAGTPNT